jgi:hypothetical protein
LTSHDESDKPRGAEQNRARGPNIRGEGDEFGDWQSREVDRPRSREVDRHRSREVDRHRSGEVDRPRSREVDRLQPVDVPSPTSSPSPPVSVLYTIIAVLLLAIVILLGYIASQHSSEDVNSASPSQTTQPSSTTATPTPTMTSPTDTVTTEVPTSSAPAPTSRYLVAYGPALLTVRAGNCNGGMSVDMDIPQTQPPRAVDADFGFSKCYETPSGKGGIGVNSETTVAAILPDKSPKPTAESCFTALQRSALPANGPSIEPKPGQTWCFEHSAEGLRNANSQQQINALEITSVNNDSSTFTATAYGWRVSS